MNCFQQSPLNGVVRDRHEAVDNDMQYSRSVPKVGDGRRKKKDSVRNNEQESQARHDRKLKGNELQSKWDEMYSRLVKYKDYHGHCLVPNRYKADPSLGAWVSTQRRQYKILIAKGSDSTPMTPERANKLMSIGFVWATKDPRHVPWDVRFQELITYKKTYGDCLVPVGFKENSQLSNWVSTQRQEYKQLCDGRPSRLNHEKVKMLESVGFVWEAMRGSAARRKTIKKVKEETRKNRNQTPSYPTKNFYSSMPNPMIGPPMPFRAPYPPPMFQMRPPMPYQQVSSFPPENRAVPNATKSRIPPYVPNGAFYGPQPYSNFPPFNGAPGYFAGLPQEPGFHYPPKSRRRSGRGSRRSRKKSDETVEVLSSDTESGSSSSLAYEENEGDHSWSNESRKKTKKTKRSKISHKNGQQPEFASYPNIQKTPRPFFRKDLKSDVQNAGDTAKDHTIKRKEEVNIMKGPPPQVTSGCTSSLMQLNGRGLRERTTFPLNNMYREGIEMGARQQSSIKIDDDSDIFADAEEDNACTDPNFI